MQDFKLLSALLCYPEQELIGALPHIRQVVAQNASLQTGLTPLLDYLGSHELIRLQENYVASIDRNQPSVIACICLSIFMAKVAIAAKPWSICLRNTVSTALSEWQ
jgi:nitrate reductase assembly molybdenum cofactor insertion protein NarJ